MMNLTRFCLMVLLLLSWPVFAAEPVDSGVLLGKFPVIRWMDNQRVMFLAASGQTCSRSEKPDSYKQPLNRIAIFDSQTRQLTWYGDVGVNGLCYADGNIGYARRLVSNGLCPKDEWVHLRGRFGEEKVQQPPSSLDIYSCLPVTEVQSSPEWLKTARKSGRMFTPLKPEHGWAEMAFARRPDGSRDTFKGMHPIRVYPAGDSEQGTPVVGLEDVDLRSIWHYSRFKNAYLLEEWVRATPRTVGLVRSWWLYPDGRVEPALHYDRALRKGDTGWVENKIVPTRAGYLQVHERSYSRLPFANAKTGLYMFRPDGTFDKIAGGRIEWTGLTVSPDGCGVAFGSDERYAEGRDQYTLKLIDVCTK